MRQKWKEEVWRNQSEIVLKSELAFKESLKVYEVDKHKERLAPNFKLQSPFMTWQEKCNVMLEEYTFQRRTDEFLLVPIFALFLQVIYE